MLYSPCSPLVQCLAVMIACATTISALDKAATAPGKDGYVGNQACSGCHEAIYQSYSKTAMAHASGPASDNLIPADFVHRPSGVHYRIYNENGRVWLSFERPGDPLVRGRRELLYYVGSGRRGRSYLFLTDGFLFESPVNWYANKSWDMAPAYQDVQHMPLSLPAYTSCLHCHVSGMQTPVAGTENRYPMPVFSQAGVACERCHGPGAAHVKGGPIVNPSKLDAQRRDAVCMQCHLEGKVAIETAGRHVYDYRPGELLADYIRYYIFEDATNLGAVSQVEALTQSACKKKSGDRMSCTSCHDPHFSPSAEEKAAYYRGKCLSCHGASFAARHHSDRPDCVSCHMPASQSADVAHTQVTDHRIPTRPDVVVRSPEHSTKADTPRLAIFPASSPSDPRELALAWESLAERGIPSAAERAESLLKDALKQSPNDSAMLTALGYLAQRKGAVDLAAGLYEKSLTVDPTSVDAASNLGVIRAQASHLQEAVKLWEGAFQRDPGRTGIGLNLAQTFCHAGQIEEARSFILRVLAFDPDSPDAKKWMQSLNRTPPNCLH